MPIIVSDIKCPVNSPKEEIIKLAISSLKLKRSDILGAGIYKISLDARKREDIHRVCSAVLRLRSPEREKALARKTGCRYFEEKEPEMIRSGVKRDGRTVIAGFGPAGMFCALTLAENGYRPIVLERGADVDSRTKAVERFWSGGELDPETNVQFGEGGAGTFSDGKLTTRIGDPLCRYVLKRFHEMGAPEEILYLAKPHIGTDRLREIVKNIRKRIISLGGEVRFLTKLDGINIKNGSAVSVSAGGVEIPTASLTLAIGHSSRDTFELLLKRGLTLEPKAFSVGARIEHLQRDVDISLYGAESESLGLPKGEYQLSHRRPDGRGAYTFCICPGGEVVAAASEPGGVVTNGMSRYLRDGKNANAALVVSVGKEDFPAGALGGVMFARAIEQKAYSCTGSFYAPCETVGAFLDDISPERIVTPSYLPGTREAPLDKFLPGFVTEMMKEGLRKFSREMPCFGLPSAVLTAPETRTSSPVRITRGENGVSLGTDNIYPCGEGAGYAGGIMSAAVDGIRTARKIMEEYGAGD